MTWDLRTSINGSSEGNLFLTPGSRRSPGEGNGYPLQYSCPETSMDRGAWWAIYSPWGCKESDMTEQLSFHFTSLQPLLTHSASLKCRQHSAHEQELPCTSIVPLASKSFLSASLCNMPGTQLSSLPSLYYFIWYPTSEDIIIISNSVETETQKSGVGFPSPAS